MDELHKQIIRTNRSFVVNNLANVHDVVDRLLEKEILTESMVQDIMAEKTPIAQVRRLLDILPKRGPFAFSIFCNVLMLSKYDFIAKRLDPTLGNSQTSPLPPSSAPQQSYPQPVSLVKTGNQASRGSGSQPSSRSEQSKTPSNEKPSMPSPQPLPKPAELRGSGDISAKPAVPPNDYKPELGRHLSREVEKTYAPSDEAIDAEWPEGLNLKPFDNKDFEMNPCTQEDLKTQLNDTERYPIDNIKRGRAVIINNRTFKEQYAERVTSDNDSFRFNKVLKSLGFITVQRSEQNAEDIRQLLKKEQLNDQKDMFILVIMSYGGAGTILCHGGGEISIQEVVNMFSSTNCSSLAGKPKLFFIQACGAKMKDIQVEPESPNDTRDREHMDKVMDGLQKLHLGPPEGDMRDTRPGSASSISDQLILEDTRDILVAMATSPDQTTDPLYSSLFILGLSYVLCRYARSEHLRQLLTRVNQLKRDRSSGQYVQLCEIKDSLTNKLYFLPGFAPSTAAQSEAEFKSSLPSIGNTKCS